MSAAQQGLVADTSQLVVLESGSLLAFNSCGCGESGQRWLAQLKPGPLAGTAEGVALCSCYRQAMSEGNTPRDRALEALRALPPDATYDDLIERLVFLARIEEGLAQLDAGESLSHDDVKRGLSA